MPVKLRGQILNDKSQDYNKKFSFCSWSGGKDSALSLFYAQQQGLNVSVLFTMMIENSERSRSNGIHRDVLQAQAESLGIQWTCTSSTWENYTDCYKQAISKFVKHRVNSGIFGDIETESHRQWGVDICNKFSMKAFHPLWQREREQLLNEFIDLGFEAYIICTKKGVVDPSFIGKKIDNKLVVKLSQLPIDICGEYGEYHTVVTNGPNFLNPLNVEVADPILINGMWVSDVLLCENPK